MPQKNYHWVITSNHLLEGDAIWLDHYGNWTKQPESARVFFEKNDAEKMLQNVDKDRHIHVGAYLAESETGDSQSFQPLHTREKIRTVGPSNYFHGKQANQ